MPDITPTLALRELVFYEEKPFYIVSHKIMYTPTGNKVVYQIAQDLPNEFGIGRGTFPNELSIFDREKLMSQAEWDFFQLSKFEIGANNREYTLTGLPIITLLGEEDIQYVFDGNLTYPWDGESFPPYDPANSFALNTIWDDPGATVRDTSDEGHAGVNGSTVHVGNILWDGAIYSIDNPDFNLYVYISYTDSNGVTSVIPNINMSLIGEYHLTYKVIDHQGISSYATSRTVTINDLPVRPLSEC